MRRKASRAVSYVAALALGGVAIPALVSAQEAQEDPYQQPSQEPMPQGQGQQKQQPQKQAGMKKIQKTSMTATVESIDTENRIVTLRDDQGKTHELKVDEDADLSKVKQGDKVRADYVESLALSLSRPGEPQPQVNVEEAARRLPDGVEMGRRISGTAEVVKVDKQNNTVTLRGPQGREMKVHASTQAAQKSMEKLKAGDQVNAVYTQAVAIKLEPAG